MMKQADQRNLTMVMDLYELTMANGYFNDGDMETRVAFDVFYRKNPDRGGFTIFAGLEQIVLRIDQRRDHSEDRLIWIHDRPLRKRIDISLKLKFSRDSDSACGSDVWHSCEWYDGTQLGDVL